MSKRSVTRVRIEVAITLPANHTPKQAVEQLTQLINSPEATGLGLAKQVKLLGKETHYLT